MDILNIQSLQTTLVLSATDLEAVIRRVIGDFLAEKEMEKRENETRLTREEVCRRLRVDKSTLWRWDKSGYLKPVRQGRKVFYRETDVIDLEDGHSTTKANRDSLK